MKGIGKEIPLITAASKGLTDIIKCLLEAGADPNVRDCVSSSTLRIVNSLS